MNIPARSTAHSVIAPIAILVAAMLSIQTGASLAKQLFPVLGPTGTATLRLCFATLILCLIWRPWRFRLTRANVRPIIYYGLALGFMNLLIYLSLLYIPLGIAVALEFTGPLAVAILASRKPLDFLWIAFAILGILLLIPESSGQSLHWKGIAYALGAGVCWALYIVFGQKAGASFPSGMVTTLGMVVATLAITPIGIANTGAVLLHYPLWPAALAVALLSSALPYYLEMVALKALPTKTFGVLMSMEPAIAALSGLIILGEQLFLLQWLAIACIIAASAGCALSVTKPALTPELPT